MRQECETMEILIHYWRKYKLVQLFFWLFSFTRLPNPFSSVFLFCFQSQKVESWRLYHLSSLDINFKFDSANGWHWQRTKGLSERSWNFFLRTWNTGDEICFFLIPLIVGREIRQGWNFHTLMSSKFTYGNIYTIQKLSYMH